jgi:hypothetical protein
MDRWFVGLDSWVIQDGNYTDLAVGDELEFALNFYAHEFDAAPPGPVAAQRKKDDYYEVLAQVTYRADDAWTIDFGLGAYEEQPSPPVETGMFVRALIQLGVDPFSYLADLAPRDDAPALVYTWRLERIGLQTAPLVETAPRHFERDRSRWGWKEIPRTDAWNDDGGTAVYQLECTLLPVEPKRKSEKRGGLFPGDAQ